PPIASSGSPCERTPKICGAALNHYRFEKSPCSGQIGQSPAQWQTMILRVRSGALMRLPSLEAVRGLAALLVILHHWAFIFTVHVPVQRLITQHRYAELFRQTIVDLSTLGPAAVLVFFVMSGFVLTLSLNRKDKSYREFVATRLVR